jgi:hypothetical protein
MSIGRTTEDINPAEVAATAERMIARHKQGAAGWANGHAVSYPSKTYGFRYWSAVHAEILRREPRQKGF